MADRFFIAPYDKSSGLTNNVKPWTPKAASSRIKYFTRSSLMSRENRVDTIDMVGKRSGKLLVIKKTPIKDLRGAYWLCLCDCGNETIAGGASLRRIGPKARKSCGCLATDKLEETGVNRLFSGYKRKAKLRGVLFDLSLTVFRDLVKGNCFYCNVEPKQKLMRMRNMEKLQIYYNGIDKVDHKKGYTQSNCVSACKYCNLAKTNLSLDDFKAHVERMYKWLTNSL